MTGSSPLAQHLAPLRQYARALTGSQRSGDAFVSATLEALLTHREAMDRSVSPRVALYKAFHAIWSSANQVDSAIEISGVAGKATQRLRALTPLSRQALLLTSIEGFSLDDAAAIIGAEREKVAELVTFARAEVQRQMSARVLIVEDEVLIAMDLSQIVESLGHSVIATVDTAAKAIALAKEHGPNLILADIQLADGSSGVDAIRSILESVSVPVVFITAYPDRLLTGDRPEPTFLITKPYLEWTVQAAVSQALFFESSADTR